MIDDQDIFLTTEEVCRMFRYNRTALFRARRSGIIRVYARIGKRGAIRYSLRELREALLVSDEQLWEAMKELKSMRKRRTKVKDVSTDAPTSSQPAS